MKKEAEELFDKKYLPLLKQMYVCGFNDAIRKNVELVEKALWNVSQRKRKLLPDINFKTKKIKEVDKK